ncbi:MAG: tetratricopeptide repeat protein, partial [Stellaceae bacterium]
MSGNAAAQAETPAPEAAPAAGQTPGITPTIQPQDPAIPGNARQAFMAAAQRHQAGDNDGAMKLYMRALELHPPFADAYNNIGVILRAQEKLPAAAACFKRALSIREANSAVYSNLGNVLWQMLRFEEAATAFKRALELEPTRPETLHNLGLLLHSMGDYPRAVDCFERSLAAKDGNVDVLWDRSLTRLVMGDFDRGWLEYEIRWRLKHNPPRRFPFPLWEGQESRSLSLLVHHEQGLGDTIHFCRYLPMVAPKVGRLVFECQPELARLMTCIPGVAEVIPSGRQTPACDYHVPLLNLPRYFHTNFDSIPAPIPYLSAPPGTSAPTIHRPAGTKLAIGIV